MQVLPIAPRLPLMSPEDLDQLRQAKELLQNPGLAIRLSNLVGTPVEKMIQRLPKGLSGKLGTLTQTALEQALRGAVFTMKPRAGEASPRWHKAAVAASGGVGGFFGLAALAIELPVSTTLMCRAIADIARAQGESLDDPRTMMACLEVFALGGSSKADDGAETGYFAVRGALAKSVSDAAEHIARQGLGRKGAPVLLDAIGRIATRFNVKLSEKLAAQAVPVVGAATAAAINVLFMDHFQDMSRGHFTVRRLERVYGPEVVRRHWDRL